MKDSQYLQSLEKSKLKTQRDSTVYLLEWPKLERLTIPRGDKDGQTLDSHTLPLKM